MLVCGIHNVLLVANFYKGKRLVAVYRLDEGNLVISSPSVYSYKVHQVVTLLNKKAARHFLQVPFRVYLYFPYIFHRFY